MKSEFTVASLSLLLAVTAHGQTPDVDWEYEVSYPIQLTKLHTLANYAFDLEWQLEWEKRRLSDNALRVNTGSVSTDELMTNVELNINEALNEHWRFVGHYRRNGQFERSFQTDRLALGIERLIGTSHGVHITVDPQYEKEFMEVAAGYTWYGESRETYARVGLLLQDFNYDSKNSEGGSSALEAKAIEWSARLDLGSDWSLYSEGLLSTGFERTYPNAQKSPELASHDRQESTAQLRVSKSGDDGSLWSFWGEWWDFAEAKTYRTPGFDYEYDNSQWNVAAEHTRVLHERHRLRFLLHYVAQSAASVGFNEHNYERSDVLGGVFYEFLRPQSAWSIAYALTLPDIQFMSPDRNDYELDEYHDKIIGGFRYEFSSNAEIRLSVSHEFSDNGFGGASVQYQMFF